VTWSDLTVRSRHLIRRFSGGASGFPAHGCDTAGIPGATHVGRAIGNGTARRRSRIMRRPVRGDAGTARSGHARYNGLLPVTLGKRCKAAHDHCFNACTATAWRATSEQIGLE
jgi:hypothetical protein